MYDEKEILKRLDMADAKAQKAKKKRAITMYMSFFILSFLHRSFPNPFVNFN